MSEINKAGGNIAERTGIHISVTPATTAEAAVTFPCSPGHSNFKTYII
jgi:hypothetical protein